MNSLGKVVNDFHINRLINMLKDHQGNVIIGNPNAYEDKVLTPTVIMNPSRDAPLMKDELFGPILPVLSFQTIDDAIRIINEEQKALVVYYFGNVTFNANLQRMQKETSSGSLVTNEVLF